MTIALLSRGLQGGGRALGAGAVLVDLQHARLHERVQLDVLVLDALLRDLLRPALRLEVVPVLTEARVDLRFALGASGDV